MNEESQKRYYTLLEQLLENINRPKDVDFDTINDILVELFKVLRVSKAIAEFYPSQDHEKASKGQIFVCFESTGSNKVAFTKRIVTKAMTVIRCTVYMLEDEEPFDDEELKKVEIVCNVMLNFIAYDGLQGIVEDLTFYDEDGYRNVRAFMRFLYELKLKTNIGNYSAIHFNLKHFTLVNQEIGRSAGDMAMRNYYELIERIIGSEGIVCRLGGDNFVAIVNNERLSDIISIIEGAPVEYDCNDSARIMVSATAGVYRIPEDHTSEDSRDILDKAVVASQAAKKGDKENVVYYDDNMILEKEKTMRIQQMFPEALANKEYQVYYQPKIDIGTGIIIGAEALCRWIRDDEVISPADFIPILEQSSDICKLDFYMLDCVCKDIRRWLDEKRDVVRVSVNFSRKHMMDVDFLEHIIRVIDDNNVPHKFIELELTETTTDVEFRDLKRIVSGLQKAGIYTSVDDFGMGYSSLNLIKEINWNVLKVDKSFLPIDEDDDKSTRSIMFKYVVAMAKELGLETLAEGVETKNQIEILKNNNCNLAQGYYFDKPLPKNDFEERLDQHKYEM